MELPCQNSFASIHTPYFLSNPCSNIELAGTPLVTLSNNNGTLVVNNVPLEQVSNWSAYPTLSNLITFSPGEVIQVISGNLYFNNEIIALASNISNVADWYLYSALSNVMLNTAVGVSFAGKVLQGSATDLQYDSVSVLPSTWASYPASSNVEMSNKQVRWIGNTLEGSSGSLLYNGNNINPSQWSLYPALQDVNISNYSISNVSNVSSSGTLAISSISNTNINAKNISLVSDYSFNILGTPTIDLIAQNGRQGKINITANKGYLTGLPGVVTITAQGGVIDEVGFGGLIELDANTGIGTYTATSAIKMSAAGINSYAGAIPSIGSLAGYNFIYGTAGVNICAGIPSVIPNTPLTTYLYGTAGIELGSDTYVKNIYPTLGGDLTIAGRTLPVTQNVRLCNVSVLSMTSGAITGVSTINGSAYLPICNWACNVAVTNVNMCNFSILNVSNINGSAYPPAGSWVGTATSDLNMCNYNISNVSNINGFVYSPLCNWSCNVAVTNVNMCNYSISNVSNIQLSNVNGLLYVPVNNWSSNVAISDVNMCNYSLLNVSNINGSLYSPTCNWATFPANSNVFMGLNNIQLSNTGTTQNIILSGTGTFGNMGLRLGVPTGGLGDIYLRNTYFNYGVSIFARVDQNLILNNSNGCNVIAVVSNVQNWASNVAVTNLDMASYNIVNVTSINGVPFVPAVGIAYDLYVAPNGSDSVGTGSIINPYRTIGFALTSAGMIAEINPVTIHLSSGTYTENVSVTRNNTYLVGVSVLPQQSIINGNVLFAVTTSLGNIQGGIEGCILNQFSSTGTTTTTTSLTVASCAMLTGMVVGQTSTASYDITVNACTITPSCAITSVRCNFVQVAFSTSGTNSLLTSTGFGSFTLFACFLTSTSASTSASALCRVNTTVSVGLSITINNTNMIYTSSAVDVGTNKCCIQMANTVVQPIQIINSLLICQGATVGVGGLIQCVQKTGAGSVTMTYANNFAGATANHYAPTITKTAYVAVT